MRQLFLVSFVCNTVERKRYVVEEFKANPSSSQSLGGDSPNHNQTVGLYAAIKFSLNRPEPVSSVPSPKVVASPPSDSVWSVDFWFRKIIKIVTRSQILRLCTKFYFDWGSGPTWEAYSAPSALADPEEVWGYTTF